VEIRGSYSRNTSPQVNRALDFGSLADDDASRESTSSNKHATITEDPVLAVRISSADEAFISRTPSPDFLAPATPFPSCQAALPAPPEPNVEPSPAQQHNLPCQALGVASIPGGTSQALQDQVAALLASGKDPQQVQANLMQLIAKAAAAAGNGNSSSSSSPSGTVPGNVEAAALGASNVNAGASAVAIIATQAPGSRSVVIIALKVATAFLVVNGLACAIGLLALLLAVVLCIQDDSSAFAATISEWLYS
jgi:hypothetical protein